jgi:Spy/CpxP family protein refolding chaperone
MDIFTQKKLLIRIVILLTMLNLLFIGLFLWKDFFHRPPRPDQNTNKPGDVSSILQRELNLSKEQVAQIRVLRSSYLETEKGLADEIRSERDSINMIMFNKSTNEELVRSLARRVADNDYKMELLRFEQAQEFKSACTPEQLEKFERLIKEIRDYFKQDDEPKRK